LDLQECGDYSEDNSFLNQMVEFLIDELHTQLENGNADCAAAIAHKIRETQTSL